VGTFFGGKVHLIRREIRYGILGYSAFLFVCIFVPENDDNTWRLTENNKRRVEATEVDALRRSTNISRKEIIRNVTIRQQIGLEETIIKEN
jgi:hypothetical protein